MIQQPLPYLHRIYTESSEHFWDYLLASHPSVFCLRSTVSPLACPISNPAQRCPISRISTPSNNLIPFKLFKLLKLFPLKICTSANFVVPLQSQTKSLWTYYKKRLLALVLVNGNPAKISQTQSKKAVNALGICISRRRASTRGLLCLVAFHIQRGRFLLVLVCRVLQEPPFREQARIRFHAFFVVKIAGSEPTAKKMTCYSTHLSSQSFSQ